MTFLDTNKLPELIAALKAAGLKELDFTVPEGRFKLVLADGVLPIVPEELDELPPVVELSMYDRLGVKDFRGK